MITLVWFIYEQTSHKIRCQPGRRRIQRRIREEVLFSISKGLGIQQIPCKLMIIDGLELVLRAGHNGDCAPSPCRLYFDPPPQAICVTIICVLLNCRCPSQSQNSWLYGPGCSGVADIWGHSPFFLGGGYWFVNAVLGVGFKYRGVPLPLWVFHYSRVLRCNCLVLYFATWRVQELFRLKVCPIFMFLI